MKTHQRTVGKNDEWITPWEITQNLGPFDLDPACPEFVQRPIASCCWAKSDDGLSKEWKGRVWLKPPFNRYERPKWMRKMAEHGNGIMLIPAATETQAFFDYVWAKATAVCFVKGRPHFDYVDLTRASFNCGTALVLVAYGAFNRMRLEDANLGKVMTLKPTPP